jgi:hypothetical protein
MAPALSTPLWHVERPAGGHNKDVIAGGPGSTGE